MTTTTIPPYALPAVKPLVTGRHRPSVARTRPEPVLRMVARRAADDPDRIAVEDGGYFFTYAQVWHAAARTRRDLVEAGVEPGDVVVVAAEPGADLVGAVLGVWLAGAAYLPFDPFSPAPSSVQAVVVAAGVRPPAGPPVVRIVEVVAAPTEAPYAPLPDGDSVACLLPVAARHGRPGFTRLSHDDLAALAGGHPSSAAGVPVLELFLPLVTRGRLRLGR